MTSGVLFFSSRISRSAPITTRFFFGVISIKFFSAKLAYLVNSLLLRSPCIPLSGFRGFRPWDLLGSPGISWDLLGSVLGIKKM
ncbi:hypothetical protein DU74_12920 [Methanosarcina mazei]|uniref:Uncharacterized protein n=1 Tax=Methanosarcina mazei TaxID=2209 RepID=A0A0F8J411_METMZ|nr:hypothetical protein DU63_08675 [Methanosarcina mazei]KKH61712.1 hypothetical protein DU74_12920 [Methanosarcina mazei]